MAEGGDFLERQKDDTYQFRIIVAPEDCGRMATSNRSSVILWRIWRGPHTKLDWVAVDHFNTGHPHTHVIIAGHDDRGQDLVMARHYISHGIRHRAQDLATRNSGRSSRSSAHQARQRDEGRAVHIARSGPPEGRPGERARRGRHARRRPRPASSAGWSATAARANGIGRRKADRRLDPRSPARNQAPQPRRAGRHHGHDESCHA